MKAPTRATTAVAALFAVLLSILLAAPLALAENGVGLAGPTTDKTVTFFCFGVIGFFAILVVVLTLVQERLERRKEARKYDLQRYG
jgi:putative copper export protein